MWYGKNHKFCAQNYDESSETVRWRKEVTGRSQGRKGMQGKQLVFGSCVPKVRGQEGGFAISGSKQLSAGWDRLHRVLSVGFRMQLQQEEWSDHQREFFCGSLPSGTKGDVYLIWSSSDLGLMLSIFWLGVYLTCLRKCWNLDISEEGENPESELKTESCFWYLS